MSLPRKLFFKLRPPRESALVSTGCLHCPVAEQKTKTDPQPCSSTESHEELRTYNKALQLNRHCAPSLHLMVCMCVFVCVNGWGRKCFETKVKKRCYSGKGKGRWSIVRSERKEGRDKKRESQTASKQRHPQAFQMLKVNSSTPSRSNFQIKPQTVILK